jgi:hypothetical protein
MKVGFIYKLSRIILLSLLCLSTKDKMLAQTQTLDAPMSSSSENTSKKVLPFADFGNSSTTTNQGATITKIAYAEHPGDATISSITAAGKALLVKGNLTSNKGSQYAGITVMFGRDKAASSIDLSSYKAMRISLSSSTTSTLRIRIAGSDQKTLDSGCYPVSVKAVKPLMVEYIIPFARFEPESYCGKNGKHLKSFIAGVLFVEVADNTIKKKPTDFSVKKIEFIR